MDPYQQYPFYQQYPYYPYYPALDPLPPALAPGVPCAPFPPAVQPPPPAEELHHVNFDDEAMDHHDEAVELDDEVAELTSGQLGQSSPSYSPDQFDLEEAQVAPDAPLFTPFQVVDPSILDGHRLQK